MGRRVLLCIVLATAAAGLAACGGSSPSRATVTVTAPATSTAATVTATAPATSTAGTVTAPAPGTTTDSTVTVIDAVGKNYETAQGIWRGEGLHVFPATDALGLGRIPIIDSNWFVVDQDPKGGTRVSRGSFITATVKKYSDK